MESTAAAKAAKVSDLPPAAAPEPQILETSDAILALDDRPQELVLIPEWKGAVYVRALNGSDRDSLEAETLEPPAQGRPATVRHQDFRARLCVRAVVRRDGSRLFQDSDWPTLATRSAAALDRIAEAAVRLSRMGQQDVDRLMGESAAARPYASPTA